MSECISHSSDAMVRFLKERVEAHQGISLQKLTGHLSQLPPELRTKYGCSAKSLMIFLQKFPDIFIIRNDANVYVETEDRQATSSLNGSAGSFVASASDSGTNEIDIPCLTDVTGTVYRLFTLYGFISIQSPVRTSIYFDVQSFENAQNTSLPSSGLRVGDKVIFDARKGPKDCKAKYRASRVARATTTEELFSSPGLSPDNANDGTMSDCNAFSHLVDQYGVVEHVKSSYGFIKFGLDDSERAFFHTNNVDKLLRKSIKNIPDVFSVGDIVRFNAKLSMKPSEKVKWEATTVHLYRSANNDGPVDFQDPNGNEVFLSDDEFDFDDLVRAKLDEYQSGEAGFTVFPEGCAGWDESFPKADSCDASIKGKSNVMPSLEWERRQKLSGERGFFYPWNESVGTVKFGHGRGLVAYAAVQVTYRDETRIDNLLWEVADGEEVSFDAVRGDDSSWIATLVWIGQRPEKPLVGDSEEVFNGVNNQTEGAQKRFPKVEAGPRGGFGPEESGQRLKENAKDRENSLCFEDFEVGIEQAGKAARGPSRVTSETVVPEETVPIRARVVSNSVSVAGLLAAGNDKVRLRLAEMVAAKIASAKESLRAVLRDVGVQTVDEDLSTLPKSRPGDLVPAHRRSSSSTQTASTGDIKSAELFIS